MIKKKKKFKFNPRNISSNKGKKICNTSDDNTFNSNNLFKKNNIIQSKFNCIDYGKSNVLIKASTKVENENSNLQYLMSANEENNIDFICTFLRLKGVQVGQTNNQKKNYSDKKIYIETEKNSKIIKEISKEKKDNKNIIKQRELSKTYNKANNSKTKKCVKEVTINLFDLEPQKLVKTIIKKEKSPKKKSIEKKKERKPKENELKIIKTKTLQKSPNKTLQSQIPDNYNNQNYKKEIENKKKQLLEGKLLTTKINRKFGKLNRNYKIYNRTNIAKKSNNFNFPIIEEIEEDKSNITAGKINKKKKENINPKINEKIESYINEDIDDNQEDNKFNVIINDNNSSFLNETLSDDTIILNIKKNNNVSSFLSSNTFNNDLVNYKSSERNYYIINNTLDNLNNLTNRTISIMTNSVLNNNCNFLIENNNDGEIKNKEQNDISDITLSDNIKKLQQKEIMNNIRDSLDISSQNEKSIVEQFDINNIKNQNESKEIKLSQIKIIKNNEENINKSNMLLSLSNISKLTNFDDSKFYEINRHYNDKVDNINLNNNIKKIPTFKQIIPSEKNEIIKEKAITPNKMNIKNDNYFNIQNERKLEEKEPKDRLRKKESPEDNYKKRIKNLNTVKNSGKNIFEDEDINPSQKLVHTNKKDIIYINLENIYKKNKPSQIIFNNQMKEEKKRNKSRDTYLERFILNENNENKTLNKKGYYYTSISPIKKSNLANINKNISIKNNINNNIIINYKN